jgi:hypothetical protein
MKKVVFNLVLVAGGLTLLLGLLHFVFLLDIMSESVFSAIPSAQRNFVLLGTCAIGICLLTFGSLTLYFANAFVVGEKYARVFIFSQALLWIARSVLELLFPVEIPLLIFENPATIVLVCVVGMAVLYVVPLVLQRKASGLAA